jgi:C4-dicarboxylate transporter DctM subunit
VALAIVAALVALSMLGGCAGKDTATKTGNITIYDKLDLALAVNGTDIATDTKVANYFANLVSEESGGQITVSVFATDTLAGGNATKGIELAAIGAVDLAAYASSTMSVLDERLLVGTIPWAFDNYAQAREALDGAGGAYYAKILAPKGLTYLASAHNGFRQISNNKRPVKVPADVAGLKIRVPGGEVYMKTFALFGADPVAMSWSEVFTAIQQGTLDGQENGFSVSDSAKLYEIQKYMTEWNYTYENYIFVANSQVFDAMNEPTRRLIREKALQSCAWGRNYVETEEANLKKKFIDAGMEITTLNSEQLEPFKEKAADIRRYFAEKYGQEACEAFGIEEVGK